MDRELDASSDIAAWGAGRLWGAGVALVVAVCPAAGVAAAFRGAGAGADGDGGPRAGRGDGGGFGDGGAGIRGGDLQPRRGAGGEGSQAAGGSGEGGDEIFSLDTSASRLDLGKMEDQFAKKANEQEQLRISLESSLKDLRGQIEAQKLDVEALAYRAEQNRKLRAEGWSRRRPSRRPRWRRRRPDPTRATPGFGKTRPTGRPTLSCRD